MTSGPVERKSRAAAFFPFLLHLFEKTRRLFTPPSLRDNLRIILWIQTPKLAPKMLRKEPSLLGPAPSLDALASSPPTLMRKSKRPLQPMWQPHYPRVVPGATSCRTSRLIPLREQMNPQPSAPCPQTRPCTSAAALPRAEDASL